VSRAYYGSFHSARLLVESCGVKCPESAESHDKVAKCLQNCGDPDAVVAGRELNSLRSARNQADYRLHQQQFRDAAYVQLQLGLAARIHEALLTAKDNLAHLRGPIQAYARDILRMPLHSDD